MMQVRMTPEDTAVHIFALRHVQTITSNAEMIEHATQLAAHLEFRAVRLWGAQWRTIQVESDDDPRPSLIIENLRLPGELWTLQCLTPNG
jgi:hypothetical protein